MCAADFAFALGAVKFENNQVQVYHHPQPSELLINSELNKFPSYKLNKDGIYQHYSGKSAHEILDLPFCWI